MTGRRVAVFGGGYVGLVTAACFASLGHAVVVRDIRPEKVAMLNAGQVPIYEPGLAELIAANRSRLSFTLDASEAVRDAEVAYVCVDTPPTVAGDADLSRVWSVVEDLLHAPELAAVVVKSTVPVGTGVRIRAALDDAGMGHVGYAANPEFTAEGTAVSDFMTPDRIVIGAWDDQSAETVRELHAGVDGPVAVMDVESAEMVKLASNALLVTRISFANEIANLCELTGADVEKVTAAVGMDHRLGPHFLGAGVGYGGSCFPKDTLALKQLASNSGYHFQLLNAVIEVNEVQQRRAVHKLKAELGDLRDAKIALLGLTYKPGTDDVRESPSIVIASRLLAEGAQLTCWDPLARLDDTTPWSSMTRHTQALDALRDCDAAVVVTAWPQLAELDWAEAGQVMRQHVVVDGRNVLDPESLRSLGFSYLGFGRA